MILGLEEKHVRELEENRQRLEQTLPPNPKDSAELLNMRKIQKQLAKQKEYALYFKPSQIRRGTQGANKVPRAGERRDGQAHSDAT